jgi:spore germination protein GerM
VSPRRVQRRCHPAVVRWLLAAAVASASVPAAASPAAAQAATAGTAVRAGTVELRVYFNHAQRAGTVDDCAIVFPVARPVPSTEGVATAALRQLFAGPTEAERAQGYRSPFSATTADLLKRLRIEHGTAYVDLNDLRAQLPGASSSCGAAEFGMQVERTLRQFPSVRRVILAIDGEPRRFYEWMGQDCDSSTDHCDAVPFRHGR